MRLVPNDLRARLLTSGANRDADHVPILKLFDPTGAATWLITEMDPEAPDILFGLCDLGMGFPELGSVSLAELESATGRLGLGIERDLYFAGRFPLSVYAEAARIAGYITEAKPLLAQAAAALSRMSGSPSPNPELPPPADPKR
jgi:hypothetical protein